MSNVLHPIPSRLNLIIAFARFPQPRAGGLDHA
jgi:hypothetical protein